MTIITCARCKRPNMHHQGRGLCAGCYSHTRRHEVPRQTYKYHVADPTVAQIYRYDPTKEGLERWLSFGEIETMRAVWERWESNYASPVSVIQTMINRPLAYTTTMTSLARLAEKGMLYREQRGQAYVYRPVDDDEQAFIARQIRAVLESLGLTDEMAERCVSECVIEVEA